MLPCEKDNAEVENASKICKSRNVLDYLCAISTMSDLWAQCFSRKRAFS